MAHKKSVGRHPACEHDTSDSWRSTADKDFLQTEKGLNCWKKWLLTFQRDNGNDIMLFDLLLLIESTGFAKRLRDSDWRRWVSTDSDIKSINNLNCSH